MILRTLGWDEQWQQAFEPYAARGLAAGRILVEHKGRYEAATDTVELRAELAGSLHHKATMRSDLPAVGDFVALRLPGSDGPALIQAVLPRRTAFVRKAANQLSDDQVVAANIDTVFIVDGLDSDLNLRRLERYLALAWASGVAPVIVLNKADLADDSAARLAEVRAIAVGVPVHIISARMCLGLEQLEPHLRSGCSVGLLGPSGVGKSTLINQLLGHDFQPTQEVRASDRRGRHTTTDRHLFVRPDGGMLIDTPGMRELQLWYSESGTESVFDEFELLAARCRFRDCQHAREPGCAVRAAVERGELDPERLKNRAKMLRELRHADTLEQVKARRRRKLDLKAMSGIDRNDREKRFRPRAAQGWRAIRRNGRTWRDG